MALQKTTNCVQNTAHLERLVCTAVSTILDSLAEIIIDECFSFGSFNLCVHNIDSNHQNQISI
jgi:hypothetical protein